jgi:hypothetical protein
MPIEIPKEVEEYCLNIVTIHNGIKGAHLVLLMISNFIHMDSAMLRKTPAILSAEGKILEIEFIIPGQKSQSLFLPKDTVIHWGGV